MAKKKNASGAQLQKKKKNENKWGQPEKSPV